MALTQPKKPVAGAFGVFLNEKWPEFMKACGKRTSAIPKMAGEQWKKFSEEQKQPYQKKYEYTKAQFEKDMADFIKSGGQKAKGTRALINERKAIKDVNKARKARDVDAPKKPPTSRELAETHETIHASPLEQERIVSRTRKRWKRELVLSWGNEALFGNDATLAQAPSTPSLLDQFPEAQTPIAIQSVPGFYARESSALTQLDHQPTSRESESSAVPVTPIPSPISPVPKAGEKNGEPVARKITYSGEKTLSEGNIGELAHDGKKHAWQNYSKANGIGATRPRHGNFRILRRRLRQKTQTEGTFANRADGEAPLSENSHAESSTHGHGNFRTVRRRFRQKTKIEDAFANRADDEAPLCENSHGESSTHGGMAAISEQVLAVLPPEAPVGHPAWTRVHFQKKEHKVRFRMSKKGNSFRVSPKRCGSREIAERVARACFLKLYDGGSWAAMRDFYDEICFKLKMIQRSERDAKLKLSDDKQFSFGAFRFRFFTCGQLRYWQATCYFHRRNHTCACKKRLYVEGDTLQDSELCIRWLKAWCNAASTYDRQRHHVRHKMEYSSLPSMEVLDRECIDKRSNVSRRNLCRDLKTDEELDAVGKSKDDPALDDVLPILPSVRSPAFVEEAWQARKSFNYGCFTFKYRGRQDSYYYGAFGSWMAVCRFHCRDKRTECRRILRISGPGESHMEMCIRKLKTWCNAAPSYDRQRHHAQHTFDDHPAPMAVLDLECITTAPSSIKTDEELDALGKSKHDKME